ncbi:hypothetical protein NUU61_000667 [Penicillium alfredii]|uniref:Wax synthase domain-containing protein n=1 Tax=Penicillium alfredii TaxID=1506179 RepID=A0A9W9GA43_9EURO|nr:uncharacterized protein NUU61_000667 [Penicillium alfredii]KAJ5114908.1 hypothetical protein NUU61_000667 [Penicillium alfredii]
MYGLRSSLLGNLVEFGCFYLIQHLLPATLLIATPKRSPLRYACIPCMIWIASQFIHPIASSSSPTWCQMVSQLIIVTVQATHLLLINPLDRQNLSRGATHVRSYGTHLVRAVRLLVHTRGVNTPWQVKNVPSHPGYYARRGMSTPPRGRFLLRQSLILAWQYLALDIVQTVSLQQTSGLDSQKPMVSGIQWNVPAEQWIERVITHLSLWFFVTRVIGDSAYCTLSIIFVGLGVDSPSDWPPAWGRMADAYTLRNFWG